jgi:3-dehydroquinate dehydratase-2
MKILVIHGPNLNLLGEREPDVYGRLTLKEINKKLSRFADTINIEIDFFQSNHEGDIIDCLHKNRKHVAGVVINPGAFTHYSYAIRDAISAIQIPVIEVHLSDISKREAFRKNSVLKDVCLTQISGKGVNSYLEAIQVLNQKYNRKNL